MKYRIGDITTLINGYAFKSKEFMPFGVPIIKIKNVKAGKLILSNFSFVKEDYVNLKSE